MKPIHGVFALAIIGTAIPSVSNLGNFASKVTTARAEASRIGDDMTELTLSQQEQEQKNEVVSALRLTPIGRGALATSKSASAGSRERSTKGVRCSNPSPYSPLTQSPALPLKKLKPSIMTAFGSLGSSPCNANYRPGRLPKDVSGSQGRYCAREDCCSGRSTSTIDLLCLRTKDQGPR